MNSERNIWKLNQSLSGTTPAEVVEWGFEEFAPQIAMSSSFQTHSVPLLHIVSRVTPQLPIIFLDTGYHFPETLAFRDHLRKEWNLNIRIVRAEGSPNRLDRESGELYRHNPDLCCYRNKVEPMERAMKEMRAWISGIRRDQSPARNGIEVVEAMNQDTLRLHPFAAWTEKDIRTYRRKYNLPAHPLLEEGYTSVGCAPCTRPAHSQEAGDRSGRWAGRAKTECGLHTSLRGFFDEPQLDLVQIDGKR